MMKAYISSVNSIKRVLADAVGYARRRDPGAQEIWQSTILIGSITTAFGVLGLLTIWVWAAGITHHSTTAGFNLRSVLGCDVLVAGAAAAVGGLLGFVFGIPRTLDPASRVAVATAASQNGPVASSQAALAANTNLERVSDWLTTLLIGATLVQSRDVVRWIGGVGAQLSAGRISNDHIIPVIIVYYGALTFIGIYLITRLYLTYALQQTLFLLTGNYKDYPLPTLKADLADAIASGEPDDLARVGAEFDLWHFQGSDIDDTGLNYSLVRVFTRLIAIGSADPSSDTTNAYIEKLKPSLLRALRSANVKKQLAIDLENGRLTTGIPAVDLDIKTQISAP